jgi:RNA polymerase sigma-70 factor, ECF subfamily
MTYDRSPIERASVPLDPTDATLVARTRDGDAGALETLVRRHYRAAYAVALAQTANHADAEDVCHDAFVRAAARLNECKQPDRFAQWLCAIVRNHARNAVSKGIVRRATTLDHATAASSSSPVRDAERAELRERLTRALSSLSPVQREVVLLHDLDGWEHDDIAGVIGTSSGMSRQHLFKARKRLREELGEFNSSEYFNE